MDEFGRHMHEHTHEGYTLARLHAHLERYHKDDDWNDVEDWESHDHFTKVKIAAHYSDRIDVHPWALERLAKAELVFFGIEGCPKADAMLQNILDTGINASVVSVPAVGMWNAPELREVAERVLSGKIVVIVPDGDWAYNPMVENQARVFQARLMEYGVRDVLIAAPPVEAEFDENGEPVLDNKGQQVVHAPKVEYDGKMEELKGVDDFLGLGGGTLADLTCISCTPLPRKEIEEWVINHLPPRDRKYRTDYINGLVNMITALSLCGSATGEIKLTVSMIGGYMNTHHQQVSKRIQELKDLGAITVEGDFSTNKSFWGGLQWEGDKPAIILSPELRGEVQQSPLGSVLPQIWGSK